MRGLARMWKVSRIKYIVNFVMLLISPALRHRTLKNRIVNASKSYTAPCIQ